MCLPGSNTLAYCTKVSKSFWEIWSKFSKIISTFNSDRRPIIFCIRSKSFQHVKTLITAQLFQSLANVTKLFMAVRYDFTIKARAFVPGTPLQPSPKGQVPAFYLTQAFGVCMLWSVCTIHNSLLEATSTIYHAVIYDRKLIYSIDHWPMHVLTK
jgi:hypothetical protein